jgi:hypothetical protein
VPRAVIVASGDLDNLPREIQTVANELSAAGWRVRLCIGGDASRVGLLQAAGEGDCDLAWFGLHSSSAGFELSDGTWPASQMGVWLRNVNCRDVVLNSCYSSEHVDMIQRAAEVNAAVAIDPAGVDDTLAWQVGVYLVRSYIISENLQSAVRQLKELLDVVKGDWRQPGLLPRFNELSVQLATIANEHRQWREEVEHRLASMERERFIQVSPRLMSFGVAFGVVVAVVLLFLLLRLGGTI